MPVRRVVIDTHTRQLYIETEQSQCHTLLRAWRQGKHDWGNDWDAPLPLPHDHPIFTSPNPRFVVVFSEKD